MSRARRAGILACVGLALLAGAARAAGPPTLEALLAAVVGIHAEVPADARTAAFLGTERSGSGVVIDGDGLVVTIGYLILEASKVEIGLADGTRVPARVLSYDHETGFGLLRALAPLERIAPMRLGDSTVLAPRDPVLVSSYGGPAATRPAMTVSRRTFAGYWEYVLEDAIFTTPPHPFFGGAALLDARGELVGIGSLIVDDALPGERPTPGNMFVPVDRLKTALGDLLTSGRSSAPARPWLGVYTEELGGRLFVRRLAEDGPAARSGLEPGDIIVAVDGAEVGTLIEFYRRVWAVGGPGDEIPLTVLKGNRLEEIAVRSGDRYRWLRLDPSL